MDMVTFAFVFGYVILGMVAAAAIISTYYQAKMRYQIRSMEAQARCNARVVSGMKAMNESLGKAVGKN